jgi:hypothetical protein
MGASNAIRAYAAYGADLGDHALRVFVYMALIAMDGDAEPWFGLGHEALSELALGRKVPDKDEDPAEHEAALRSVRRAVTELQAKGAIRTSERARFGSQRAQNARYRLYLDKPCPEGEQPPPRQWKRTRPDAERPTGPDAERPMGEDGERPVDRDSDIRDVRVPPDAERPMPADAERPSPPDAGRPAGGETIGRFVAGHRTLSVQPPDAERPTKEEEEEEERINDGSVAASTVEGTTPDLRVVNGTTDHRGGGGPGAPGQGSLYPFSVPSPPSEAPSCPDYGPPCGTCDALTRQVEAGDGTFNPCPRCHPTKKAAS